MSDWKKMTKEQKAKRNARRRALHAERKAAAAAKAAAKPCKCGKKHPCKACPKKAAPAPEQKFKIEIDSNDNVSVGQDLAIKILGFETDARLAVEKCAFKVSNALMELVRTFRPEITSLVWKLKDAPKKDEKAVPAKK